MAENNQPATKQDLIEAKDELKKELLSLEDRLIEKTRDMQTEVLRAFERESPSSLH